MGAPQRYWNRLRTSSESASRPMHAPVTIRLCYPIARCHPAPITTHLSCCNSSNIPDEHQGVTSAALCCMPAPSVRHQSPTVEVVAATLPSCTSTLSSEQQLSLTAPFPSLPEVRGDLIRIITKLLKRRSKFDAIVIETTGLADPAPVIQTFFVDGE